MLVDKTRGLWIEGGPVQVGLLGTHEGPFLHQDQDTASLEYHMGPPPQLNVLIQTEVGATCWMN